jgi:uncharacterized protein
MNEGLLEIFLRDEPFLLLPQKAMYRPGKRQLILSDLHLGKATHFRKQGIPLPERSLLKDFDMLEFLLKTWKPQAVLILGDLFHSDYNREWLWFRSLLAGYPDVEFILVEGNHDILKAGDYHIDNLHKVAYLEEERFIFSHHPLKHAQQFNVCGHVHPGIRLRGAARQSMTLPCFYERRDQLILPAFGSLTGLQLMELKDSATYYLITKDSVVRL